MGKRFTRLQREVALLLLMITAIGGIFAYHENHPVNEHPGMIRLHVVANSDTPEDQMLKRKVRNEMIRMMEGQDDIEAARTYIDGNLQEMEALAETVIRGGGASYGAKAERKVSFIPEKSYEDLTLPAGNYEALKITLGEGKGQNWWCVIFPQLCLIGEESGSEKLVLKSKIKEMIIEQEKRAEPA
ncbi:MAG: stage II sporulation protein R [Firmicutes bacterium]|nr:stage II sporulation protein R [Bacillota bacterium]